METKAINSKVFDVDKIRSDFPILNTLIKGKKLVYLDNAATTQKPIQVIDAITNYYSNYNSNVHRGVHYLSELATKAYEDARLKVKNFINAKSISEIIFTSGTTDSINLLASSFSKKYIKDGDEVIISGMEHHSNIVPWQLLKDDKNISIKIIPIDEDGNLLIDKLENLITDKTKLISIVYASNSLGTINDVKSIINIAKKYKIKVAIDAAQAAVHIPIDVQELDCDFLSFSGHKLYGPTGVGVLYGKEEWLNEMPPYRGGGDMILNVTFEKTTFNTLPYKFEAGTPNIEGVIALGSAIDYLSSNDIILISNYERMLLDYANEKSLEIDGLRRIGTAKSKCSIFSFVLDGVHPHDVGTFLDFEGIAIRTGHHCTQPVMDFFCVPATSRASFAMYNTKEEIDILFSGIKKIIEVFR